eukprot:m.71159 g.71159  ORF g.71159 m.71159 type:complete len:59 (-) comp12217_c0_seq1:1584-1760(-)
MIRDGNIVMLVKTQNLRLCTSSPHSTPPDAIESTQTLVFPQGPFSNNQASSHIKVEDS